MAVAATLYNLETRERIGKWQGGEIPSPGYPVIFENGWYAIRGWVNPVKRRKLFVMPMEKR